MFYDSPGSQQTQNSLFSRQVGHRRPASVVLCNLRATDSSYERIVDECKEKEWQKISSNKADVAKTTSY